MIRLVMKKKKHIVNFSSCFGKFFKNKLRKFKFIKSIFEIN